MPKEPMGIPATTVGIAEGDLLLFNLCSALYFVYFSS
jgi:hypothetical protein